MAVTEAVCWVRYVNLVEGFVWFTGFTGSAKSYRKWVEARVQEGEEGKGTDADSRTWR